MSDGPHQRRCWDCGNVAEHSDSITPWVLCGKCGSQDTRRVKLLEPQKYPEYQVPAAEPTPASGKDIDYEDSFRDARDLLLIVSPDVTPLDSLSGIVSQLNNYIAGLKADRDEKLRRALADDWEFFAAIETLRDEKDAIKSEVCVVLMMLDELAELWGDEGKFRTCRDRLRKLVSR